MDPHELKQAFADLGKDWKDFKERNVKRIELLEGGEKHFAQQLAEIEDRLDQIVMDGAVPRKADTGYREFYDGNRKCFAISSKANLMDVPELRPKEKCPISLDRWARALFLGNNCSDKEAVEFVADQKSVTTGNTGVLVPEAFRSQWIDMARAQSVLVQAGAMTVPMEAQTVTYSHQTSDPTFSWRTSEGASLSATDPGFTSRQLSAVTVAVRTRVSLEASQDIPNFGAQIASAYTKAFGAAIDKAGIQGEGGSPLTILGLHNEAGTGSVSSVGVPTNYDELVDAVAVFLNANNRRDELTGIIWHPNVWKTYAKLKTGLSSDNTPLELPPAIADVPTFTTTNADTVSSPENYHVVLGNFADMVIGVRMDPSIRILDNTTKLRPATCCLKLSALRAIDFLPLRPASFVIMDGLISA